MPSRLQRRAARLLAAIDAATFVIATASTATAAFATTAAAAIAAATAVSRNLASPSRRPLTDVRHSG